MSKRGGIFLLSVFSYFFDLGILFMTLSKVLRKEGVSH